MWWKTPVSLQVCEITSVAEVKQRGNQKHIGNELSLKDQRQNNSAAT